MSVVATAGLPMCRLGDGEACSLEEVVEYDGGHARHAPPTDHGQRRPVSRDPPREPGRALTAQLYAWNAASCCGKVFDSSAAFRLPDGATRSPDAAWLESPRWDALTPLARRSFPPLCPDFVAELLSPSDDLDETRAKMEDYITNGARLGWLLDPFRKAVEIYRPDSKPETRFGVHSIEGEDVLAGFVLDLREILAD